MRALQQYSPVSVCSMKLRCKVIHAFCEPQIAGIKMKSCESHGKHFQIVLQTAEKYGNEASNHILRIRYLTQASTRPPTLVAFVSGSADYPTASIKFLGNALRQEFGFDGVPLRIDIRMRKAEGGVKGKRSSNRGRSTNRPARPYQRQRMAAWCSVETTMHMLASTSTNVFVLSDDISTSTSRDWLSYVMPWYLMLVTLISRFVMHENIRYHSVFNLGLGCLFYAAQAACTEPNTNVVLWGPKVS